MKLTVVGAAGVRTPHLVKAIVDQSKDLGISKISLMDIDGERLRLLNSVIQDMFLDYETQPNISITTDSKEALEDTDFVIFTIRVGNTEGRAWDESIPLKYGVLGQETTGPGGFAMAMRTIPVILDYVKMIEEVAPQAWVLNLTNPAGLITQAVTDYGFTRIVGICDTPSELFGDVARGMGIPEEELWFEYFGINHLGWVKRVLHHGIDITNEVLDNDQALLRHGDSMLDPDFIRIIGMVPNEYLMFYYRHNEIVQRVQENKVTRAQIIADLNKRLFSELKEAEKMGEEGAALRVYQQYSHARDASYMKVETSDLDHETLISSLWDSAQETAMASDEGSATGYAGIALSVLRGLSGKDAHVIVLNAVNHGAITDLDKSDIVELPCYVDINGVHPIVVSHIPEESRGLLQVVKNYERLTVQAATEGSYKKALQALSAHPFVPDALTAQAILDDFIEAHGEYFPELS